MYKSGVAGVLSRRPRRTRFGERFSLSAIHVILGSLLMIPALIVFVRSTPSRLADHLRSAFRAFLLVAGHACLMRLAVPAVGIGANAGATRPGGLWTAHAARPATSSAPASTTSTHFTHLLTSSAPSRRSDSLDHSRYVQPARPSARSTRTGREQLVPRRAAAVGARDVCARAHRHLERLATIPTVIFVDRHVLLTPIRPCPSTCSRAPRGWFLQTGWPPPARAPAC